MYLKKKELSKKEMVSENLTRKSSIINYMIHIFLILAKDSIGYFRFKICLDMTYVKVWAPCADAVIKEKKDAQKERCVAHVVIV